VVRAKADAQEILDDAAQVVDDATQIATEARQVAVNAGAAAEQIQDMVVSLKQADLPQAARREGTAMLERLAMDASAETRARAARAMGEVADPTFLPVLMGMLADQIEVQREALASLALVVGSDVTADRQNPPGTTDERVHRWQLWYQEHPGYRNPRAR
jgi:HEAT repeat protein